MVAGGKRAAAGAEGEDAPGGRVDVAADRAVRLGDRGDLVEELGRVLVRGGERERAELEVRADPPDGVCR